MHHIQLSDQVYFEVKRRADEAGYDSVEDYVVNLLTVDVFEDTENLERLFTPERLAIIDQSLAEVRAGAKTYTIEEVSERLEIN